jgi:hypothetical protein
MTGNGFLTRAFSTARLPFALLKYPAIRWRILTRFPWVPVPAAKNYEITLLYGRCFKFSCIDFTEPTIHF